MTIVIVPNIISIIKTEIKSEVAKLLNVAMTRAETFFILIGDTEGIKSMKEEFLLKDWISEIEQL